MKMFRIKIFFNLLVLLTCTGNLQAWEKGIYFGTIPPESGLSQMSVSCIYQDSKGFLWFGTRDGLNRYDGYTFEVFRNKKGDSTSISNNNIAGITEDNQGNIWVATDGGLNRYHYGTNTFACFHRSNSPQGISHEKVGSLHQDRRGRLWIGTEQGLDLYDPETRTFKKTRLDGILYNNRILSILYDSYGNLWIGTLNAGLIRYYPESGDYEVFRHHASVPGHLSGNTVRTLFEDSKRNFWVGTRTGLSLYDPAKNSFLNFGEDIFKGEKLSNDGVRCLAEDHEGNLLIGTNEGLNILNLSTGSLRRYNPLKKREGNLNHFYVYSVFVDRAGTVWLGNYMGGINYYHKFNQQFKYSNPGSQEQLIYGGAGPMLQSGNKLWIGSGGRGLFCYNETTDTYSHHLLGDSSFISNIVRSLYITNDSVFIGTDTDGLLLFDKKRKKVVRSFHISDAPVLNIYPEKEGRLLLCVRDTFGLRLFDPKTGVSEPFTYPGNNRKMLFPYATCMEPDHDSIYWIGTRYTGIYRYNRVKNSVIRYQYQPDNPEGLSERDINVIYNDSRNSLWIGTNGGGLCRFSKDSLKFKTYREKDGLSNEIVLGILPDQAGFLWISTLSGISKFDPVKGDFKNYTYGNGFPLQELAENSFVKLSDGRLCYGGNNGIVVFDPGKIVSNSFIPPVVVTEFKLLRPDKNRTEKLPQRKFVPNNETIRLKYSQSSFVIGYTALNYIFPERNRYAYQLEGFDYDWNQVGKQRMAIYTNLPAGDYRFKVKASNNDGVWNEEYVCLRIKILPPPWLSWYAYLFYMVLFGGLSFSLLHYIKLENKLKIKQIEQDNLEKVHQLRIRMFTNFSHELRTPLTLIAGPLEDLLDGGDLGYAVRQPLMMIRKNVHRLLLIVNQLMDFRKQESGKMQLKASEGNFSDFLREISLAFGEKAKKQKISYTYRAAEEISLWFDRLLLEKVFFNLLSNAFKNTPANGEIAIRVSVKSREELNGLLKYPEENLADEYAEVVVEDNGRGISEENLEKIFDPFYQVVDCGNVPSAGTGIGLSLSKGIVELHSGFIRAASVPGKGACFKVFLPRGRKHLREQEIAPLPGKGEDYAGYLLPDDPEGGEEIVTVNTLSEKQTVLLVEDHAEVRNYLKTHLKDAFNVVEAVNGEEGFLKAVSEMPDLVISDVMMPVMSGVELCHKLKNDVNTSHVPVVLVTALTALSQMKQGFDAGADDYITKPFSPAVLKMKIRSLIETREKLRNAFCKKFPFEQANTNTSDFDRQFLDKIYETLDKHLSDPEFDLDAFSGEIGMSRANLYRKIKALTNFAPNELLKNYRLRASVKLLEENQHTVSEIAYMVGFSTPSYFSNCFKKTYGFSPTEFGEKKACGV